MSMTRWFSLCTVGCALAGNGCKSLVDRPDAAAEISPRDFSQVPVADSHLDIVQVPSSVFAPEAVEVSSDEHALGQGESVTTQKSLVETNDDGTKRTVAIGLPTEDIRVVPGEKWTIDSLVGQINGRPIYASQFMASIEDRILRIVAENPRARSQRLIEELVAERFEQYINNELIIAEAEGLLTPEMQQGVFAWLQSIQEQTVAGYGGNRASASQTLQDQFGMTMDQYLKEKRDEALAQDLLRRRVKPRTIVSWRDIEREYTRFEKEFNPAPTIKIGRIRLAPPDEVVVKDVEARIARGESFAQLVEALKLPDGGLWQQYEMPANGIAGIPLADEIRNLLASTPTGKVTSSLHKPASVTWYCVMEIQEQASRSLYDAVLQRQIRGALEEQRGRREQFRYLRKLRDRWVTSDIDQMTRRLTVIAWDRYLPAS